MTDGKVRFEMLKRWSEETADCYPIGLASAGRGDEVREKGGEHKMATEHEVQINNRGRNGRGVRSYGGVA